MHAKGNQINARCYAFSTTLFPEKYYEIWKFRIKGVLRLRKFFRIEHKNEK